MITVTIQTTPRLDEDQVAVDFHSAVEDIPSSRCSSSKVEGVSSSGVVDMVVEDNSTSSSSGDKLVGFDGRWLENNRESVHRCLSRISVICSTYVLHKLRLFVLLAL